MAHESTPINVSQAAAAGVLFLGHGARAALTNKIILAPPAGQAYFISVSIVDNYLRNLYMSLEVARMNTGHLAT